MILKENNQVKNYVNIVDSFVEAIALDPSVKKVGLYVFKNKGSISELVAPFMTLEKNKYLVSKLKEAKIQMPMLTASRLSADDKYCVTKLLNKEKGISKIIVIDAYSKESLNNMFDSVKEEIKLLTKNLKYISMINDEASIYVLGMPKPEGKISNTMRLKLKFIDKIYEELISRYSNVTYVKTTTSRKQFEDLTNGEAYKQIGKLLEAISLTFPIHQSNILNKKAALNKNKTSIIENMISYANEKDLVKEYDENFNNTLNYLENNKKLQKTKGYYN